MLEFKTAAACSSVTSKTNQTFITGRLFYFI